MRKPIYLSRLSVFSGSIICLAVVIIGASLLPVEAGLDSGIDSIGADHSLDPLPPGGDCQRLGWNYSANPFNGWPIEERVCERSVIVWDYCSTRYPTIEPHWGVDLAYPGIEGIAVVSTTDQALVGRMHDQGYWNGGMGNYVELRAVECWKEKQRMLCIGGFCVARPLAFQLPGVVAGADDEQVEVCVETGWVATYMHLMDVAVTVGQRVDRGDVIGHVGAEGNASGFHLHYEITSPFNQPGGAVDPFPTLCDEWIEE
jgi:murein DD-endopeptidase MepM/ murein hydrolase activator NlpD